MTVLDNIMTGRNLKMRCNFLQQALWLGPAKREEIAHRRAVEEIIDFLEIQHIRKTPVGRCPTGCRSASSSGARSPPSRSCCCSTSRWRA